MQLRWPSGSSVSLSNPMAQQFLSAVLKDLKSTAGKCVVIPGEGASQAVHSLRWR